MTKFVKNIITFNLIARLNTKYLVSVSYTCIFMDDVESESLETHTLQYLFWCR